MDYGGNMLPAYLCGPGCNGSTKALPPTVSDHNLFYGLRFAYRPEDMPGWLDPLFPASMGAAALGLLLLVAGLIVRFGRGG